MSNSKSTNSNSSNSSNKNNDYINICEKDKIAIELLKLLLVANIISFIADTLSINATINGIKVINKKYTKSNEKVFSPDALALYSIYFGFLSRILVTKVGISKCELAYKEYYGGNRSVNLNNFKIINLANGIFIIGSLISMVVAENIYEGTGLNIFV